MSLLQFSESNIANSVALYVADQLLAANYLLYWQDRDLLQVSPTAWYPEFSVHKATLLADPTVAAAIAAADGLLTVVQTLPALPRFVVRLIDDASVGDADVVPVPALAIELGPPVPLARYELGTPAKWRARHLVCDAYVRSAAEASRFKDLFARWFDPDTLLGIQDHDAGDLAEVGTVMVQDATVASMTVPEAAEATTYEVLLNARLVYVA
jgi:hypothetical protein